MFIFRYIKVRFYLFIYFFSLWLTSLDFRRVIPDLYFWWEKYPAPETDFFFFFLPILHVLNNVVVPARCWANLGVSQLSLQNPAHYKFCISALFNPAVQWKCTSGRGLAGSILIQKFVFYFVVKQIINVAGFSIHHFETPKHICM